MNAFCQTAPSYSLSRMDRRLQLRIITDRFRLGSLLGVLAWLASHSAFAEIPRAAPAAVGFSPERLARLDALLDGEVRQNRIAGAVVLVARHGKVAYLAAAGSADVSRRIPMRTDSIFRLYSMTKPISAVALMMLYEEGRFQLSDPLGKFIPEFAFLRALRTPESALTDTVEPQRPPSIHDSLRHTTGFTHGLGSDAYDRQYADSGYFELDTTLAGMMSRLAKLPLRYEPGTKWEYSVSPDIDARLVEVISGQPFDRFLEQRLFGPLGMRDTGFRVPAGQAARLASVHWLKDGKLVPLDAIHGSPSEVGLIAREPLVNSYIAEHPRKGGSYGLVATAEDYWRFAQMILNGGELDGWRILGSRTVKSMMSDHITGIGVSTSDGESFGLGFGVAADPGAMGSPGAAGSVFWGGAAATGFWIDPREELVIVSMTQHFGVEAAAGLADRVSAVVYGAIER